MEELHYIFEIITDSAVLLDKGGRIVDWNSGATALFGYSKREVLGRSLNLIYRQNYPFSQIIQETLLQQKKWVAETTFIRKNGAVGICKTAATLINHAAFNKSLALITHQNITPYKQTELELKQAADQLAKDLQHTNEQLYINYNVLLKKITACENLEKALWESELRFHLLAENATDMISRLTPDGTYLYISPSSKTLLGYSPEELMGRSVL